jgi:NAD(P)-dependent dehydrogenase (short-subunit alcohol dehydrogenase family)
MAAKGIPPDAPASLKEAFDLSGRVAVITGGAGLLGVKHGEALMELGAAVALVDLDEGRAAAAAVDLVRRFGGKAVGIGCNITDEAAVVAAQERVMRELGGAGILVNNAANNPKVEGDGSGKNFSRLENFPLAAWNMDIAVGLTGAFLCSRVFGVQMAMAGKGVIINIASDLGVIAPDQRLYRKEGLAPDQQPVKPVTYSVVKAGMIGLTRYLATYWPDRGVRCNALVPGGVYAGQDEAFLGRLADLIPQGRMAHQDEYKGAVAFLASDASSYMNGALLSVDGGRTAW